MSLAAAEKRLDEVLAHVTEIGRQLEDKSKKRKRPWASDPHEAWRKAAMQARDELRKEYSMLREWIERKRAESRKVVQARRAVDDLARQEVDRSTRDARRLATKDGQKQIWDLYLKTEVTLLAILAAGGAVGPLGESLLYSAQQAVPEWYRDHWLHTVYGTTWGRQAEALRAESIDE